MFIVTVNIFLPQALRIKPPMCITKEDVNFAIAVFRKSLERYSQGLLG